jgi:hypothetical protein
MLAARFLFRARSGARHSASVRRICSRISSQKPRSGTLSPGSGFCGEVPVGSGQSNRASTDKKLRILSNVRADTRQFPQHPVCSRLLYMCLDYLPYLVVKTRLSSCQM